MSETIIGYINSIPANELLVLESEVQQETPFGFKFTDELKLYNYPENQLQRSDIVQFVISDSSESNTATILLEEDYDPDDESESDFQKQFPSMLKDRIFEITKIIKCLVHNDSVRELGFSISFCDEIEQIKHSSIESFESVVVADCINSCPPNILYLLDK
jgi:hypothetical protein